MEMRRGGGRANDLIWSTTAFSFCLTWRKLAMSRSFSVDYLSDCSRCETCRVPWIRGLMFLVWLVLRSLGENQAMISPSPTFC
jgi:hypothetical protein